MKNQCKEQVCKQLMKPKRMFDKWSNMYRMKVEYNQSE